LKHVKENVKHGGWTEWLESVGIDETKARRLIQVVRELGDSKQATSPDLPFGKLYEIATLPPDQRDQEHEVNGQTSSGLPIGNRSTSNVIGLDALYLIATQKNDDDVGFSTRS
jgi:hypothetical protein